MASAVSPLTAGGENPLAMGAGGGPNAVGVPMTPLRAAAVRNLEYFRSTNVPVTTIGEVDVSNVKAFHDAYKPQFEAATRTPLTYLAFFARAAVLALMAYPMLNSMMTSQGYIVPRLINLGFAAQTSDGIVIPVIRNAESKGVPELARDIYSLNQQAQSGRLTSEATEGQTFVITNPGRYGLTLVGTPVIAPPNVGMLSFESIQKRVTVLPGDQPAIRPMMYIALTADHRAVDGAQMVGFVGRVKQVLENAAF